MQMSHKRVAYTFLIHSVDHMSLRYIILYYIILMQYTFSNHMSCACGCVIHVSCTGLIHVGSTMSNPLCHTHVKSTFVIHMSNLHLSYTYQIHICHTHVKSTFVIHMSVHLLLTHGSLRQACAYTCLCTCRCACTYSYTRIPHTHACLTSLHM